MTSAALSLPDPKVYLTLEELTAIQSIASSHITFSLTLACPLSCEHCIVNAAPDKGKTTMPLAVAESYAAQMPALAASGIRSVSFTGGEPLLARRQLEVLARAANDADICCGVVTAAHWATTDEAARHTVERFAMIRCWDLSVDSYHEDFVPLDSVRRAYDALIDAGRRVTVRFTYHQPMTEAERRILEFIGTLPEAGFSCQRVRGVGRGALLKLRTSHEHNPWLKPCLTQGMVVRYDGSVAPCCLNLVEERNHPFQLGDARARPLTEIHRDYMAMPLLQLIRAVGFSEIMRWLTEAGLAERLPARLPDEVCEICAIVMRDATVAEFLRRKAAEPDIELKIAVIASRVLEENHMLRALTQAEDPKYDPSALAAARALIESQEGLRA